MAILVNTGNYHSNKSFAPQSHNKDIWFHRKPYTDPIPVYKVLAKYPWVGWVNLFINIFILGGLVTKIVFFPSAQQGIRQVNQAYSRLSTTHGHITVCKLDSVVYAGVCV